MYVCMHVCMYVCMHYHHEQSTRGVAITVHIANGLPEIDNGMTYTNGIMCDFQVYTIDVKVDRKIRHMKDTVV